MSRSSRTPRNRRSADAPRYVSFDYENARYTVSPERSKVYSDWVEVETSRAVQILTAYRSTRDA